MKNIAVYLGSAPSCKDIYKGLAYELGFRLAKAGHTLVYGGAAVGTMGALADGARDAGGEVIGVFPKGFRGTKEVRESGLEVVQHGLSKFIETADFAERKQMMEDLSDGCIVLPGSFGTLDELFTYACNRAIDVHTKPILVFNFDQGKLSIQKLQVLLHQFGFSHVEGGVSLAQGYQVPVVVEHLRIAFLVGPVELVDRVGRLKRVVHTFLVAQQLLAAQHEGNALGGEDGGLCQEVETNELFHLLSGQLAF